MQENINTGDGEKTSSTTGLWTTSGEVAGGVDIEDEDDDDEDENDIEGECEEVGGCVGGSSE